jgi:NitT/TauT family transport system substrate-binding protein
MEIGTPINNKETNEMKKEAFKRLRRLLTAACVAMSGFISPAVSSEPIKIGDIGISANAPFYIAIEKGYFKEQKLAVELVRLNSGAQGTASLSTNQLQVLQSGVSGALFNALATDWPVKVALSHTRQTPGFSSNAVIIREDLRSSVKSAKDLKGKKIAVNAPSAVLHFLLGKVLESGGLTMSDVEVVTMPFPNMGAALQTKAIDAAAITEPFVTQYEQRGLAFPLARAAEVLVNPPLETSLILFNKDWAQKNDDEVKRFTIAYLKGVRDYVEALKGGQKQAEIIDILVKYTALKDKRLYQRIQWSGMDPNGEIALESLRQQQDWYVKQRVVTKPVDVAKIVDRSYMDFAVSKIGRIESK